jgi:glucose-1-phosphate thymidylyltransferase
LEKPKNPPNNFAVTGIYLYGPKVFFEAFKKINKSDRGEYEISSIHSQFLKDKLKVGHKEITGWWKDTGQANDLLTANRLLLSMMKERKIPSGVYIDLDSFLEDFIHIGVGTQIRKGTKIIGPVIIAENCILENCVVGPYVTVGQGAEICSAHVENSIILDNSSINCDIKISHSILGKSVVLKKRLETEFAGHRMIVGDKTIIEI